VTNARLRVILSSPVVLRDDRAGSEWGQGLADGAARFTRYQ
jgi:hypothetical protein